MSLSKLGSTFRDQVRAKVGEQAVFVVRSGDPTFAELRRYYPDGPSLATALGLGRPGQHKPKTAAWRKRKNLLDDYARWRRGARGDPFTGPHGNRLRSLVRSERRKRSTPNTVRAVLNLMLEHGATVTYFKGHFYYDRRRERTITADVYVSPAVLREAGFDLFVGPPLDWDLAARAFLSAWARAYGLDDAFQEEVTGGPHEGAVTTSFDFEIGRGEHVDYDYGPAA